MIHGRSIILISNIISAWRDRLGKLGAGEAVLWLIFVEVLFHRLIFPLYYSPFEHLFSDPLRHWHNAQKIQQISMFSGIDPKGYQFFLGLLNTFLQNPEAIETAIGLLCAGTMLVWYMAARELMPRISALVAGIVIGVLPSLLIIFGYFMTETLLLFLFGLAWWLSLVCWRRPNIFLFCLAVAAWDAAMLTRIIAVPVGVAVVSLLWWILARRLKAPALLLTLLITGAMFYPAAKFTEDRLHVLTPFSYGMLNKIYAASGASQIRIFFNQETWFFQSPSYFIKPITPISDYEREKTDFFEIRVDESKGSEDWERIYKDLKQSYTADDYLRQVYNNVIFATFAPSWPDASNNAHDNIGLKLGWHQRWIWAPMIIFCLVCLLWQRYTPRQIVFILSTFALLAALYIQNDAIMEGRYRKPLEPMIVIMVAMMVTAGKKSYKFTDGEKTIFEHINHGACQLIRKIGFKI